MEKHLKNIITETISDYLIESELRKIINESLHISNYIKDIFYDITNKLPENIKLNKDKRTVDDNGVFITNGTIDERFSDQKLKIFYKFYNFKNKEEYQKLRNIYHYKFDSAFSTYDKRMSMVNVNILGISGEIQKKQLYDSIMHELSHIYKQNMGMCAMPKDISYMDKTRHVSDINIIPRCISRLFYYSYEFEQNGFVNGLYGEIMSRDEHKIPTFSDVKNTFCYKQYKMALASLRYVEKNKDNEEVTKILSQYNINNVDRFLSNCRKQLNNFLKKIGDTIIQAHDDYIQQHGLRESISPSFDQSKRYLW